MNSRLWCHLGYKKLEPIDWNDFVKLSNEEIKFLLNKKWHTIPKGIAKTELPSYHPYWRHLVRKDRILERDRHLSNLLLCEKDSGKVKYLYNKDSSLDKIKEIIKDLELKIYK